MNRMSGIPESCELRFYSCLITGKSGEALVGRIKYQIQVSLPVWLEERCRCLGIPSQQRHQSKCRVYFSSQFQANCVGPDAKIIPVEPVIRPKDIPVSNKRIQLYSQWDLQPGPGNVFNFQGAVFKKNTVIGCGQ